MTYTMAIAADPNKPKTNQVFANPFKWMSTAILRADKSYRDRQHMMHLTDRELKDVGLKRHGDHFVTMASND